MLSLKEILSKFDLDTCKGFSLYDVGISLSEISEAEKGVYLLPSTGLL